MKEKLNLTFFDLIIYYGKYFPFKPFNVREHHLNNIWFTL